MSAFVGRVDITCQGLSGPFIAKSGHTTAFTALADKALHCPIKRLFKFY